MQIVQTLNDFIKILFTPSTESLCLGDFLLVQEADEKFLGQIIEVEDDKFDEGKAVAKVKLTHSINTEGEITDYNYHTPSKQCEVLYANTREIFDFVNQGRRTFKFGEDFKFSRPFEFNLDFFKNSPLIFCDTIKEHNYFSAQLARKLSDFRNVILLDYTGSMEVEEAQRLRAKVDFKLPLDYFSLDYIWEKGISSASLETQATCEEIFNELKSFVKMTKDKFIPFNRFLSVIGGQYKSTPVKELLVLKNRLQSYQQEDLFANLKSEFTWIFEQIGKEKITIIDLSTLKSFWHKDFTEFILRNIKIDSYIFMRLNDNNFDSDLLSLMYLKNRKYSVIPSVSNLFAKFPVIAEHCPNYIIFPTKNIRKDFGVLNASISAMPEGTVMLNGKDSNNFAFLVKNLDKEFEDEEEKAGKHTSKLTFEGDVIKNLRVKDKITRMNDKKQREIEEEVDKFISSGIKIPESAPKLETTLAQSTYSAPPQVPDEPVIEEKIQPTEPVSSIPASVITPPNAPEQFSYQIEEVISEEELDLFDALNQGEASNVQEVAQEIIQENLKIEETFEDIFEEVEPKKEQLIETPETLVGAEDFLLEDLADESIKEAFEEIVDTDVAAKTEPEIPVDSDEVIRPMGVPQASEAFTPEAFETVPETFSPSEHAAQYIEEIPIFTPQIPHAAGDDGKFREGDRVLHDNYGEGKVLQIVEYSDKILLQIEFERIGKRLLDPVIAGVRKMQ